MIMPSKKVRNNIDIGLWVEYGHPQDDYNAAAFENHDAKTGETYYVISLHKGHMPAFHTKSFTTLEALETEMRQIANLRKWKIRR